MTTSDDRANELAALIFLARKRRQPLTRAAFDAAHPGMFAELYASGLIVDWRDTDAYFRVAITDSGRREIAWRTA